MKISSPAVTRAGAESGRITRVSDWTGVQPSTSACSASSAGMSRKKLVSTQIANGRENAT